ncbi:LysR family transcriptional regulator [Martelella alba]|uniref:LysR family transcriptional regulator n=1 Tax=Martelella alba TaxID=2590451 RepID=A0A506UCD1_9HYPH|nr:LysR family transcriptional regulator [Martelella alba]TPW30475.1 LysR family transcriptional regulator [Martelella alba]
MSVQSSSSNSLGALDIRLLRILSVLLEEESVSRTAELMGQTQPTISAALRRLRDILGDPLLVRSGTHLVATARAVELRPAVMRILAEIDDHFVEPGLFVPETSERRFSLIAANSLGPIFLPRFVARLRRLAPGITADLCPIPADGNVAAALETSELDIAVVNAPIEPESLRIAPLMATDLVCIMGRAHPLAGAASLSLETYLTLKHITPTPLNLAATAPIDSRLKALGHSRQITLSVPEFGVIPFIVAESDLVFTTGRAFAEHLSETLPIAIVPAPEALSRMKFQMLWHERQHRSPANRWLREQVKATFADIAVEMEAGEQG